MWASLFGRGRRGRALFRPYELDVLDAVAERLSPEARSLLERQVEAVGHVQRLFDDTDVSLYPRRSGPQVRDPAIAFPNLDEDLRLATVRVAGGRVQVSVVLGHLFQVSFRPPPKELAGAGRRGIVVEAVTIHADPMIPTDGGIEARLAELDPGLRAELESMWADGSAADSGVARTSEIYRIGLADGDRMVLWQDDATFLVALIEPARPGVLRVSPDDGVLAEYPDLRTALTDGEASFWA